MSIYGGILTLVGTVSIASGLHGLSKPSNRPSKEGEMVKIAIGVTILAAVAFISLQSTQNNDLFYGRDTEHCPEFMQLRRNLQKNPLATKLFQLADEARGIDCHNYLTWKSSFSPYGYSVYGIEPHHLKKPVMWGIHPERDLPFIAIRYTCQKVSKVLTTYAHSWKNQLEWDLSKLQDVTCLSHLNAASASEGFEWLGDLLKTGSAYSFFNDRITQLDQA